jgi:hypothetical protein
MPVGSLSSGCADALLVLILGLPLEELAVARDPRIDPCVPIIRAPGLVGALPHIAAGAANAAWMRQSSIGIALAEPDRGFAVTGV